MIAKSNDVCPQCEKDVPIGCNLCTDCIEAKMNEEELEGGSAKMTLTDIYAMFYLLVKQTQKAHPGSKMSFDLRSFKTLPKKPEVYFERKHGRLFAWIPEKPSDRKKQKKSNIIVPDTLKIIDPNNPYFKL